MRDVDVSIGERSGVATRCGANVVLDLPSIVAVLIGYA